jgi:hypothetical protein
MRPSQAAQDHFGRDGVAVQRHGPDGVPDDTMVAGPDET